jgi:hypothetical protein
MGDHSPPAAIRGFSLKAQTHYSKPQHRDVEGMENHQQLRKAVMLIALFVGLAPAAAGTPASLSKCQGIKNKIDHYTDLRRGGGSARRMSNWKQRRDHYQDQFSEHNCKRWRNRLD